VAKSETIKEQLAILRTENKAQTKSIDNLAGLMTQHVTSSEPFRIQCSKNKSNITWLKGGILSLFGILGSIIVWIVSSILLR